MGVWGYKVGDSDQALDEIDMMARDEEYLISMLNRKDILYYSNSEIVLCAIALIDASINGFSTDIWSNTVIENDYIKAVQCVIKHNPKIFILRDALYKLDIIEMIEKSSGWNDEEMQKSRMELIELLKSRLKKSYEEIIDFVYSYRENILTGVG